MVKMKPWILGLLAFSLAFSGCTCGTKSDEEILKERLDTIKVHLYLATKIAILKADQSADAKRVRAQLVRAGRAAGGSGGKDAAGDAKPSAGAKSMSAADYLELAKALYALRAEGKKLLDSGDESGMQPVLSKLLSPEPALSKVLDLNFEHALLLTGLFALKFHPKTPLPIPDELVLYEASMTKAGKLPEGLRSLVRSIKSVAYANNKLCDLAAAEGAGADADGRSLTGKQLAAAIGVITGAAPSDKQADEIANGARAVAHGAAASCYVRRGQKDKAVAELEKLVVALEQLGVPPHDTALVRAYIALEKGERAELKKALGQIRDHKQADPALRKDVTELLQKLEAGDDAALQAYFDKAFFGVFAAKIIYRRIDRAGGFDSIKNAEIAKTLDGYLGSAAKTLDKAGKLLSTKGLVNKLKGK